MCVPFPSLPFGFITVMAKHHLAHYITDKHTRLELSNITWTKQKNNQYSLLILTGASNITGIRVVNMSSHAPRVVFYCAVASAARRQSPPQLRRDFQCFAHSGDVGC